MMSNQLVRDVAKMILASLAVAGLFLIYLFSVGVPTTSARNLYNQAMLTANTHEKKRLLERSQEIWYTDYVATELAEVEELVGKK
jgi:hypothetical protein